MAQPAEQDQGVAGSTALIHVVVVGSCNIDLISYTPRLPKPGETIHGSKFEKGYGGKGANQCVMAAKLGAPCAMVAKLGDDEFGRGTLENFRSNGVNTDHVTFTADSSSGVAAITVNEQGENSIVIVSGANMVLSESDVLRAEPLISQAKVLICQLEVTPGVTLAALKLAKKYGVTTIFNTAPGLADLGREYFTNTDILCFNESEAETLLGTPVPDLASGRGAVEQLRDLGARCVVLTMGERGVLYSECVEGVWSDVDHIEATKVEVVDTTGAGDAFVGALAYYLTCSVGGASQMSLREMLRRAGVVASYSVTKRGTQSSYCMDKLPQELLLK